MFPFCILVRKHFYRVSATILHRKQMRKHPVSCNNLTWLDRFLSLLSSRMARRSITASFHPVNNKQSIPNCYSVCNIPFNTVHTWVVMWIMLHDLGSGVFTVPDLSFDMCVCAFLYAIIGAMSYLYRAVGTARELIKPFANQLFMPSWNSYSSFFCKMPWQHNRKRVQLWVFFLNRRKCISTQNPLPVKSSGSQPENVIYLLYDNWHCVGSPLDAQCNIWVLN